jgi:hypothetical protein
MRIVSGLTTTVALLIGSTHRSWALGTGATGSSGTALTLIILAAVVIAVVVGARFVVARRKQTERAMLLQSQLSDFVVRESLLSGLRITPTARVYGWRRPQVTLEVAGEVPTPESRETVMRLVAAEARRSQPDAIALDHLFIVPPVRTASDAVASRG